ncbi:MAG TPA: hypothetical protein VFT74_17315, partial [Isosphaeraceae bacterium]|nr:hypothetical protein [Isosphaeraceae bacterium]
MTAPRRRHLYLHAELDEVADEAGYTVADGVVIDGTEDYRPTGREFLKLTRRQTPTRDDLLAEEAAWAARSGPVYIIRR